MEEKLIFYPIFLEITSRKRKLFLDNYECLVIRNWFRMLGNYGTRGTAESTCPKCSTLSAQAFEWKFGIINDRF